MASFPSTLIYDNPHSMIVHQLPAYYSAQNEGGFNLRLYFSATLNVPIFFSHGLDTESIFRDATGNIMDSIHMANHNPTGIFWNLSNPYEYFVSSSHISQM